MTQVEKRILELEFDNKSFNANIKSTVASLEDLEKHLEMKDAGKGFENAERAASNVKFTALRSAIDAVAEKFSSFRKTAADDISSVEQSGSRFNLKNMLSAIATVGTAFLSMGRSSRDEISDIERSEQRFSLKGMAMAVQDLSDRFSALGIVGITVLQDLTNTAINAGKTLASKVIDPIVQGGKKRAFALENARFTLQGLIKDSDGGAEQIEAIMQAASDSVSGTAYALDDAASAAAQFAATGMRAGKDTHELENALKAIAGTSATVNAEYSDIAHIFTTVAGNGRLMTEQLNQFSYRGMNAAATLKDEFNAVLKGTSTLAPEIQDQIRKTVEYGMAEVKDFTGTLEGITEGDLRALVSKGKLSFDMFSAIMANTFGEHAKDANKTFNGAMANIRAALARTGAMFYSDLIVQEGPLVKFFNHVREAVNSFNRALKPFASLVTSTINSTVTYVNTFLEKLEGLHILDLLSVPLESFTKALKFVGSAFTDVFPALEDADFRKIAIGIGDFLRSLKLSNDQLITIKTIATGVASTLKIFFNVVQAGVRLVMGLARALKPLADLFMELVVYISKAITEFAKFIEESNLLDNAVDMISSAIKSVVSNLTTLLRGVWNVFVSVATAINDTVRVTEIFAAIGNKVSEIFRSIADNGGIANSILNGLASALGKVAEILDPVLSKLKDIGTTLGGKFFKTISDGLESLTFDDILHVIELIISGALSLSIKKAFDSVTSVIGSAEEFFKNIGSTLKEAGSGISDFFGSLTKVQNEIVPAQIMKIAAAVTMLAGALFLVSSLNAGELAAGTIAMGAVMGEMTAFIYGINAVTKTIDPRMIATLSGYMLALSASLLVLAIAIRKMGTMDYTEIVRGLVGLGSSMAMFTRAMTVMSKNVNPAIVTKLSGTMLGLAAAMVVLSVAFKIFSTIDFQGIAKGLIAIAGTLMAFVAYSKLVKPYEFSIAAKAIQSLGISFIELAVAFKLFSSISWEGIAKSLLVVASSLLVFVAYSKLVNPTAIAQTAGSLIALSASLIVFGVALKIFETLSWEGLAKGLITFGAAMSGFVVYSQLVNPATIVQTAGSLVLFAAAIVGLAAAFKIMDSIDTESLVMSTLALAGVLAMFVIAADSLSKSAKGMLALLVVPAVLIPLAVALGMLAAIPFEGLITGIAAVAATILIFAVAGNKLIGAIPGMLAFSATMLAVGAAIGIAGAGIGIAAAGLAIFATAIAAAGMAIIGIMVELAKQLPTIIGYLIEAFQVFLTKITEIMPQIAEFVSAGLQMLVGVFIQNLPLIMQAIGEFFLQFIGMVTTYIPQIVEMFLQFFLTLLQQFVQYIPQIADAVLQLIVTILQAVADHIQDIVAAALSIAEGFIRGIADGIGGVIDAAFELVISFINGLADAIRENHGALFEAIGNLISAIVEAIIDGIGMVIGAAGDLISGFFEGLMEFDPIGKIGQFASDLINGFIEGIGNMVGEAIDAAGQFGQSVLDEIGKAFAIASPSKKTRELGEYAGEGFIDGLNSKSGDASNSAQQFVDSFLNTFNASSSQATNTGNEVTVNVLDGMMKKAGDFTKYGLKTMTDFTSSINSMNDAARNAGVNITDNTMAGLKYNEPQYGFTGNQETSSFISNVRMLSGRAKDAGLLVTSETVRGLNFNFPQYAQTGTSEGSQYVGGISGRSGSAYIAGKQVTGESVRGLNFNAPQYGSTGTSEGNSYVAGVAGVAGGALNAGKNVTGNAVNGLGYNIRSYSDTGFHEGGLYVNGIGDRAGQSNNAGKNLSNHALDGARQGDFRGAGNDVAQGFIDGINSFAGRVWDAAANMAREALRSVRETINSNSPSKEFAKLGGYSAQGFAKGIADSTTLAVQTAGDMGKASLSALEDVLEQATLSIVYSDFDINPTITPVVDLSQVNRASADIDRIFAQSGALSNLDMRMQMAATGYDVAQTPAAPVKQAEPTVINQTYNQNNYSPKALDELEVYRKTKSMFATSRGLNKFVDGGVTYAQ